MKRPIIRFRWLLACLGVVFMFSAIQFSVSFSVTILMSFWLVAAFGLLHRSMPESFDPTRLVPFVLVLCDVVSLALGVAWYRILKSRERAGVMGAVFSQRPAAWFSAHPAGAAAPCAEPPAPALAARCAARPPALAGWRVVLGAIGLGLGLQLFASGILSLMMSLFPAAGRDYSAMMEQSGIETFSAVVLASVVIMGPILEETIYRGIVFMFAKRASASFLVANTIQAVCFGIAHLNILQGTYAFIIGLVLGLVLERTGRLWPCMLCHATVNLLAYAPTLLGAQLGVIGLLVLGALIVVSFGFVADLWVCDRPSRR